MFKLDLNHEKLRRIYLSIRYGFFVPGFDGMMNEIKCKFLYSIVMQYSGERSFIVEIGSFKGCSTTWLGMAGKRKSFKGLLAIDLFTGTPSWGQKFDTYSSFMHRMQKNKLVDFVQAIRGHSSEVIKTWGPDKRIAILHIDGDHAYAGVKADSEGYIPFVQAGGIVIFDDYDSDHLDVKRMVDELLSGGNFKIVSVVKEINGSYGSIALRKIS